MKDTPSAPAGITGSASAPSRQSAPEPAVTARGVALVTGAGQRLGRAIALALAADGWDIGVHYRESADGAAQTVADITALGRRAVALQAGLDDASQCRQLVKRLADALGPVTGLVNSASRFDFDSIHSLTPQSFAAHLGPNLLAPLLLSQALLAQLPGQADVSSTATSTAPASTPAVIVNLLDQKLFNLNPDFLSYTLSKAALQAATTMLAQAMAPHVRVVGVAPGLTLPSYLQSDTDFAHAHRTLSPLGASSTAEDVAATVVFAMKTRSITGTTLLVDGGQHLLGLPRDASLMGQA
jgi:short-chain dehydrogenase/reductase SDR